MSKSATELLAQHITHITYDDLPNDVIQKAKACLLDTLGCILGGFLDKLVVNTIQSFTVRNNALFEATMFGKNIKAPLLYAGLINGMMAHVLELDDVHKRAKVHPGTVVVPAAVTYGETVNACGKDLLLAIVIGYETMIRIGVGINAIEHRLKGWHATSTCGTFASAAAVGALTKLTPTQMTSALGLAGTQSSGLWAFTADGANNKPFHAGYAVMSGLTAVKLAESGMTGPSKIIEAKDGGLYKATSVDYNVEEISYGLGQNFKIMEISQKPFACCRSMHPAIEAVLTLRDQHQFQLEDILDIQVDTYKVAKLQCGQIVCPTSTNEAKFSMPFGIAVALVDGQAFVEQFSEDKFRDECILSLAKKVSVNVSEQFDSVYPYNWGCRVTIRLLNGQRLQVTVPDAKGDPTKPLTSNELEEKFFNLSSKTMDEDNIKAIVNMVNHLEDVSDISDLIKLCCCLRNS